jgi:hypothetical protein
MAHFGGVKSFWRTFLYPKYPGNRWAYGALVILQSWACYRSHHRGELLWAVFLAACATLNLAKLIKQLTRVDQEQL